MPNLHELRTIGLTKLKRYWLEANIAFQTNTENIEPIRTGNESTHLLAKLMLSIG